MIILDVSGGEPRFSLIGVISELIVVGGLEQRAIVAEVVVGADLVEGVLLAEELVADEGGHVALICETVVLLGAEVFLPAPTVVPVTPLQFILLLLGNDLGVDSIVLASVHAIVAGLEPCIDRAHLKVSLNHLDPLILQVESPSSLHGFGIPGELMVLDGFGITIAYSNQPIAAYLPCPE